MCTHSIDDLLPHAPLHCAATGRWSSVHYMVIHVLIIPQFSVSEFCGQNSVIICILGGTATIPTADHVLSIPMCTSTVPHKHWVIVTKVSEQYM